MAAPGGGGREGRAGDPVRVLVVDDSPTARSVLLAKLGHDPRLEVVGTANDGLAALERILELRPDVVTLDVEMPRLDGLATLERIMRECPTPVVMVSSLTREGAEATLRALDLGAVDFIAKPTVGAVAIAGRIAEDELVEKVLHASRVSLAATVRLGRSAPARAVKRSSAGVRWARRLVVIGSSTGGPQALRQVLPALPGDLGVPVLVVQHMPAAFTRPLAERLDELLALEVREARPGSLPEPGVALVAHGGFHLTLTAGGRVELDERPPEHGVRPALDVTLESVAGRQDRSVLAVVLTGMGVDGTRGCALVKAAGGDVITEAESSCVVYGMPRTVHEAGHSDESLELLRVAEAIVRRSLAAARRSA